MVLCRFEPNPGRGVKHRRCFTIGVRCCELGAAANSLRLLVIAASASSLQFAPQTAHAGVAEGISTHRFDQPTEPLAIVLAGALPR